MIGIDYDSFLICSAIGAHFLKHNTKEADSWDAVWEATRTKKMYENYKDKKLTIFAVSNLLELPKETVRRKVEILKKKKLISHSTKLGLLPTDKIDELIKPFAKKELNDLSKFLRKLKSNKSLDQLLNLKDKEI
tara:strand:+ start:175 stop:576 length:402 start_codon:yes stop_codon:yes gene_type:complete